MCFNFPDKLKILIDGGSIMKLPIRPFVEFTKKHWKEIGPI